MLFTAELYELTGRKGEVNGEFVASWEDPADAYITANYGDGYTSVSYGFQCTEITKEKYKFPDYSKEVDGGCRCLGW